MVNKDICMQFHACVHNADGLQVQVMSMQYFTLLAVSFLLDLIIFVTTVR